MQDSLLLKPLQTEKATLLAKAGKYAFLVRKDATKISVKHAFQHFYNVTPKSVNMIRGPEKTRMVGRGRMATKRSAYKKAIITLKAGKTIDIYKVKEK